MTTAKAKSVEEIAAGITRQIELSAGTQVCECQGRAEDICPFDAEEAAPLIATALRAHAAQVRERMERLHDDVMNLRHRAGGMQHDPQNYHHGHRDARHDAAELIATAIRSIDTEEAK